VTEAQPQVTAVVVTWNSQSTIARCLATLSASELSGGVRIIVVDNASGDATVAEASGAAADTVVIRNTTNVGLAAANNQGIQMATTPWVLVSNPDVIYEPTTVAELLGCGERHDRAAFVIARLTYADGSPQTSVGDLPGFAQAYLGRRASAARGATSGFWWDGWAHDEERAVGHGAESCYLVRRSAIDEIGMQDPKYFLDWEGIDWASRARAAGWQVWFTPRARAVHIEGVSIRQAKLRWVVRTHRGMYRYFSQRSAGWLHPLLAASIGGRAAVKLAAVALGRLLAKAHR
jgi:N-acetylglucosaminyl-diphospho-decaprenol L-rhamnosyltransferase